MKKLFFLCSIMPLLCPAQNIVRVAGDYISGYTGNGGPATSARLHEPNEVFGDNAGNFYIAEYGNHVVRKVDSAGIITVFAGNDTSGYTGDGGPATGAELMGPSDIAIDAAGNVYISDILANCVRKVDTSGVITTIAGNGTAGYSGNGGPATAALLDAPFALDIDAVGNIYIADGYNNCIRKINTSGTMSTFAGDSISGYAGDGGAATAAELNLPIDITHDRLGNFYIDDGGNNVIRKINSLNVISTYAGNSAPGFYGDGGPATNAELYGPYSVCTDTANNLYITDNENERIRMVNTSGIISTIAGTGAIGNTGDGGPATAATFHNTGGITFDRQGNMLIADFGNNAIRKIIFNPSSTEVPAVQALSHQWTIFPNPASASLIVSGTEEIKSLVIFNTAGDIVSCPVLSGGKSKAQIDISHLAAGLYLVQVNGTDTKEFVKE